MDWIQLELEHI